MKKLMKLLYLMIICFMFLAGCMPKNQCDENNLLEDAIHASILNYNNKQDSLYGSSENCFACEDHVILDKKADNSNMVIIYTMVLYQEYKLNENELSLITGIHIPTVLTFSLQEDNYRLEEYWIPDDGADYESEIKEKFPAEIYVDAINTQKYVKEQADSCFQQAIDYFKTKK